VSALIAVLNAAKAHGEVAWLSPRRRALFDHLRANIERGLPTHLHGPSGAGKTFLAWLLARETGATYVAGPDEIPFAAQVSFSPGTVILSEAKDLGAEVSPTPRSFASLRMTDASDGRQPATAVSKDLDGSPMAPATSGPGLAAPLLIDNCTVGAGDLRRALARAQARGWRPLLFISRAPSPDGFPSLALPAPDAAELALALRHLGAHHPLAPAPPTATDYWSALWHSLMDGGRRGVPASGSDGDSPPPALGGAP
jgi:hypothetical protein